EDVQDLIGESSEGIERVSEIVQNLMTFSRVDETKCKEADINECLENTIKVIWNELKNKAKIIKEYGELPFVKCSPQQLNQVFMNFLINAAHAIEKEGEIKIKTWQDGKDIFVSISDTGHGIPAENINKLFEPFFTTKEVGKGTGLGLSIANEIIQNHNGKINVESEVGRGTTFTVTIPVAETA
ncbi:MAG: GHKL domain-containing protein, partial [Candidatus Heimdallarchaeota archaeon]|nr:GHKL domain-containing protein [Candidatus Heimdallarchaeota archaeon]